MDIWIYYELIEIMTFFFWQEIFGRHTQRLHFWWVFARPDSVPTSVLFSLRFCCRSQIRVHYLSIIFKDIKWFFGVFLSLPTKWINKSVPFKLSTSYDFVVHHFFVSVLWSLYVIISASLSVSLSVYCLGHDDLPQFAGLGQGDRQGILKLKCVTHR